MKILSVIYILFALSIVNVSAMENPKNLQEQIEYLETTIKEKIKIDISYLRELIKFHTRLYQSKTKNTEDRLVPTKIIIAQIMKIISADLQIHRSLFPNPHDPFCDCQITLSCTAKTIERYAHNYMTQEMFNSLCDNCIKLLHILKPLWE